ncbi:HTH domain-containing protein [Halogeometricum limi]|uniref:Uncharacterized protein n=1 Tax=Halogeometricum limi TaxID=555875 RepID=A0A1I6GX26_9EURY|nr:HTH domain-containing protein [Halogeometricum limi]SFR46813.1 hypothetical protein SAMN04488124_1656 [Halogeometricum limi]
MQETVGRRQQTRAPKTDAFARGRTVEVWVRRTADRRADELPCVAQLRRLERAGAVDDVVVREWDQTVPVERPRGVRETFLRERIADFREWAWLTGAELPAFEHVETVGVGRMGPERTEQFLPPFAVAVYDDGILTAVLPHERGGHTTTVTDWLDRPEEAVRPTEPLVVC